MPHLCKTTATRWPRVRWVGPAAAVPRRAARGQRGRQTAERNLEEGVGEEGWGGHGGGQVRGCVSAGVVFASKWLWVCEDQMKP